MRTSGNMQKRIASFAKIGVLALCFALVFGLTIYMAMGNGVGLTPGVADAVTAGGQTKAYDHTDANADAYKGKVARFWDAQGVKGEHQDISPALFGNSSTNNNGSGFPGTGSDTKWYYTETFENINPNTTNQSIAKGSNNGDTWLFGYTGGKNYWGVGYESVQAETKTAWTINYEIPSFIKNIASNSNFTVKMKYQFDSLYIPKYDYKVLGFHNYRCMYQEIAFWAGASESTVQADDLVNNYDTRITSAGNRVDIKNSESSVYEHEYSQSNVASNEVTLSGGEIYFNVGFLGTTYRMEGERAGGRTKYATFSGLKIFFTIESKGVSYNSGTNINDGAAPALAEAMNLETKDTAAVSSVAPERKSSAKEQNWPLWHPDLVKELDKVVDSEGKLLSYQNLYDDDSVDFNYSKKAEVAFYDLYDYSYSGFGPETTSVTDTLKKTAGAAGFHVTGYSNGKFSWGASNPNCDYYAAGIKSININGTPIYMYTDGLFDNGHYEEIKSGSDTAIRVKFTRLTNAPENTTARVKVTLYFVKNIDVKVTATDYGNKTSSKSFDLKVSGIDTKAPGGETSLDGTNNKISMDATTEPEVALVRDGQLFSQAFNFTASETAINKNDITPYVWFMSVARADSFKGLQSIGYKYSSAADISNASNVPIIKFWDKDTCGGINFKYDFEKGQVTDYNSNVVDCGETGVGYYRFTFYLYDLAGNDGGTVDFYMHVVDHTPNFTLQIQAGSETRDSEDNGKWSNQETKLILTFDNGLNFDGNTITFSDSENILRFFSLNHDGKFEGFSASSDPNNPSELVDGGKEVKVYISVNSSSSNPVGIYITVKYQKKDGKDQLVISFEDEQGLSYIDILLDTGFTVYAAAYTRADDITREGTTRQQATDGWGKEDERTRVKIRVDRNKPNTPYFTYSSEDVAQKDVLQTYENKIPDVRKWYHRYTIDGVSANLPDNLGKYQAEYRGDISMYVGQALIQSKEDWNKLDGLKIEDKYKNITGGTYEGILVVSGTQYTDFNGEDYTYTPFELLGTTPGMRVIYVWVVDEAGNVSDLAAYYVLADATQYTVTAEKAENKLTGDGTVIKLGGGASSGTFHRGDKIKFDISRKDGYVPFKMWKGEKGTENGLLLYNYTSKNQFFANEDYKSYLSDYGFYDAGSVTFSYALDDPNSLGAMGGGNSLKFVYECRRVVSVNPNLYSNYSAEPTQVLDANFMENLSMSEKEKAAVKNQIQVAYAFATAQEDLLYVGEDGNATTTKPSEKAKFFIPTNAGKYVVYFFFADEDPDFVMDYKEKDNTPITQVSYPYEIMQITLNITLTPGSYKYGDKVVLGYTLANLQNPKNLPEADVLAAEGINIVLSLEYSNWAAVLADTEFLPASDIPYTINATILPSTNYLYNVDTAPVPDENNVYRSTVQYSVAKRDITIKPVAAEKEYGDIDPDLFFEVEANQMTWYGTDRGVGLTAVFGKLFPGLTYEENVVPYKFNSKGGIRRVQGNTPDRDPVGEYDFVNDIGGITTDTANYNVTMDVEGVKFTINKRHVELFFQSSSHSMILRQGSDPNSYVDSVTFTVDVKDAEKDGALLKEIQELLTSDKFHLISPAIVNEHPENKNFSKIYTYTISFWDYTDNVHEEDNYVFTLGDPHVYTFTILSGNAIIVSARIISIPYGSEKWIANEFTYKKFKDYISLESETELGENVNVTWDASIEGDVDGKFLTVGNYTIKLDNVKVFKDGVEVENYVAANDFTLRITPVTVTVKPTIDKLTRAYGETDDVFGISFDITEIEGKPFGKEQTWGDYNYDQIYEVIRGAFSRAIFNSDNGKFVKAGANNDFVTDGDYIVNTAQGQYYGLNASAFTLSNTFGGNFVQTVSVDDTAYKAWRFTITKRVIELDVQYFRGISRSYDGTNEVRWGNTLKYDLFAQGQLAYDDQNTAVYLTFDSEYTGIGVPARSTAVGIKISNIALAGDRSVNYVLGTIVNNARQAGSGVQGDENDELQSNSETVAVETPVVFEGNVIVVTIYYISNTNQVQHINIMAGSIGLYKTDFSITKVYDNTRNIELRNITLQRRSGDGGTQALSDAWDASKVQLTYFSQLNNVNVGNYVISITLTFQVDEANGYNILNNSSNENRIIEPDITITASNTEFVIEVRNIIVTVTQKVLTGDDFESVTAVDRDYNGSTSVGVVYAYAADALATGDRMQSVGLTFTTNAASKNAGTHAVNFDAYNFADANYGLDFDSFKAKFGDGVTKVTINKARLLPAITFTDMVYNGLAELDYTLTALTTVNYSEMLADELAQMTLSGASILLSLNGEANANVMFRDGAVVAHNVMISGLTITSDGVDLNNYVLSGFRYAGSEYVAVADALVSGEEIDDYELLDALTVTQKPIAIVQNNVVIPDKVYDGTRNATVTINLSEGDIVANDSALGDFSITATANFVRSNVGSNIAISLSGIGLVVEVTGDAYEATMLANYRLMPYTVRHYGNILARPVALEESETVINGIKTYGYLGEKVYDGSAAVRSGVANAGVDESGFISGESSAYAVQIRNGAYFVDKNVQLKREDGAIQYDEAGKAIADIKLGAIYAPTLRNTMTGVVNYQLTYAATEPDATATLYAYSGGGEIVVASSVPEGVTPDKYYYELPVADKMIEKTAYEKLAAKPVENKDAIDKLHSGIVGYIEYNGMEGYAIDSKADVSGVDAVKPIDAMTYVRSSGTITQKQVFLRGTAIEKVADSKAYNKPYDGTTKFFGVRDTDYKINPENGIGGLVKGDDVTIAEVSAVYGGADTSTTYVRFNLAQIKGYDADNYFWDGAVVTATLSASISKRDLTANLADRNMTYGTNIADLVAEIGKDITFSLGAHAVTYDGANFYMSFEEYVNYMIEAGAFVDREIDAAYIQQLKDMAYDLVDGGQYVKSYNLVDGSYVAAFADAKGEYIRLGGNFESLPVATIMFKNFTSRPNAGDTTESYTLSGGYATNFNFAPAYTQENTSVVTVLPMELYVATLGGSFTKIYAGADPQFDIAFFDANGNPSNFAPWETYTNLFIKGGADIGPVIEWVDSEGKPMGKYPDINKTYYAKVVPNQTYKDDEYSSESSSYVFHYDEITNYKFHFVDALSEEDSKFYADFGIDGMKLAASTLNVVLPSADSFNISVVSDNTDVVFNGENHTPHVLAGLLEGDEVHYADSETHIAQLVGLHNGRLVVKRYIKVDAGDPNNYAVEWTSPVDIRINITKASPQLTARNASASYNGRMREYPVLGSSYVQLLNQIAGFEFDELTEGMIEYTAEKLGADGNYSRVDSILGAGTYRVTVFLTEAFERAYPNFAMESTTATLTITKAPVDIKILEGNYERSTVNGGATGVVKLASVYVDGRSYPIDYTIENHALTGSEFAITPDMLGVHFFRENVSSETDITGAGKYSFRITPNDASIYDNYEFIGADGILELTATTLTTTDDEGEVKDSLVFAEGSNIIANELIVRRVQKSTGSGEDLALYHAIEQFMPHIDNEASVSAVLRVSLKYDNVIITDTNGVSMTLSIRIPTDVKSDLANTAVYVQQPDGSLRKLLPAGASGEAGSAAEGAMGTYEFKDGVLTFTTDFLGAIVFVDVAPAPFPMWAVWTLVAVGALVLLFLVWLVITLIVRKIKLYHIDRIF